MRLWSGWYGAAIVLPVLFVLLCPGLRNSVRRYEMGGEIVPDSLRLGAAEFGSRGFDKSKPRDTHSVGAKVWERVGVDPIYYDGDDYSTSSPVSPARVSRPKTPPSFPLHRSKNYAGFRRRIRTMLSR